VNIISDPFLDLKNLWYFLTAKDQIVADCHSWGITFYGCTGADGGNVRRPGRNPLIDFACHYPAIILWLFYESGVIVVADDSGIGLFGVKLTEDPLKSSFAWRFIALQPCWDLNKKFIGAARTPPNQTNPYSYFSPEWMAPDPFCAIRSKPLT